MAGKLIMIAMALYFITLVESNDSAFVDKYYELLKPEPRAVEETKAMLKDLVTGQYSINAQEYRYDQVKSWLAYGEPSEDQCSVKSLNKLQDHIKTFSRHQGLVDYLKQCYKDLADFCDARVAIRGEGKTKAKSVPRDIMGAEAWINKYYVLMKPEPRAVSETKTILEDLVRGQYSINGKEYRYDQVKSWLAYSVASEDQCSAKSMTKLEKYIKSFDGHRALVDYLIQCQKELVEFCERAAVARGERSEEAWVKKYYQLLEPVHRAPKETEAILRELVMGGYSINAREYRFDEVKAWLANSIVDSHQCTEKSLNKLSEDINKFSRHSGLVDYLVDCQKELLKRCQ